MQVDKVPCHVSALSLLCLYLGTVPTLAPRGYLCYLWWQCFPSHPQTLSKQLTIEPHAFLWEWQQWLANLAHRRRPSEPCYVCYLLATILIFWARKGRHREVQRRPQVNQGVGSWALTLHMRKVRVFSHCVDDSWSEVLASLGIARGQGCVFCLTFVWWRPCTGLQSMRIYWADLLYPDHLIMAHPTCCTHCSSSLS